MDISMAIRLEAVEFVGSISNLVVEAGDNGDSKLAAIHIKDARDSISTINDQLTQFESILADRSKDDNSNAS